MRRVFKYHFDRPLVMPEGAKIVKFGKQGGIFTIWAEVEPENIKMTRQVAIYGTGHPIDPGYEYLETCFDGEFVWHLYEDKR